MAGKEKNAAINSEYHVEVSYGRKKLEDCVEKMLKDKEKNLRMTDCNSGER